MEIVMKWSMRALLCVAGLTGVAVMMGGCPFNIEQPNFKSNLIPTADAGPAQSVIVNEEVLLSGAASIDGDGDPLTYSWTQVTGPRVTLQNANQQQASFTPTQAGTYDFSLTVSDGKATDEATVRVNVGQGQNPLPPESGNETPNPPDPDPDGALLSSSFDGGAEGWTIDGRNPVWNQNGGRAGAYVSSTAPDAANFSFWLSPIEWAGDYADAYGGRLKFSVRESNPSGQLQGSGQTLVVLAGGGIEIRAKVQANLSRNAWQSFDLPLDPSGGWLTSAFNTADDAATAEDIEAVLSDLSEIRIRARWGQRLEDSTTSLDEVEILAP